MAPFLSAADEVVVQSQTKSFLFELEQPPRLREIRIFGYFSWSRIHSSFTKEESRPPHPFRNWKLPIRGVERDTKYSEARGRRVSFTRAAFSTAWQNKWIPNTALPVR
jgi:hypothetical protein